jgi:hypothetical protein
MHDEDDDFVEIISDALEGVEELFKKENNHILFVLGIIVVVIVMLLFFILV